VVTERANVLDLIGEKLREEWKQALELPLPDRLRDLLAQLDRIGARPSRRRTQGDSAAQSDNATSQRSATGAEEREVGPPAPNKNPK
jgi:hypothetical protein